MICRDRTDLNIQKNNVVSQVLHYDFFNMKKPIKINAAFRQLSLQWKSQNQPCPIYEGDKVQVVDGTTNLNDQGKVIEVDSKNGTVVIEGINMKLKKLPGIDKRVKWIEVPNKISMSKVKLVDPVTNTPTKVTMLQQNGEWTRLAVESGAEMKIPKIDLFKDSKGNYSD